MSVASAARKHNSLQAQNIELIPEAAEVQAGGWSEKGNSDNGVAPVPNLNHQKIIINFSAMMDYLRLYQMPDGATPRQSAVPAFPAQEDSIPCVCCGHAARVDEIGFCNACMTAAEPS
ncbi:MAG: hypothetical protein NTY41_04945 [Proteobacteria bacterium]|nr:hypothetical protein [Pseudomonadota bacterium]